MNRLDDLETELGKLFGRYTKWRVYCKRENAITEEEKIRVAEKVLSEEGPGDLLEYLYYARELARGTRQSSGFISAETQPCNLYGSF